MFQKVVRLHALIHMHLARPDDASLHRSANSEGYSDGHSRWVAQWPDSNIWYSRLGNRIPAYVHYEVYGPWVRELQGVVYLRMWCRGPVPPASAAMHSCRSASPYTRLHPGAGTMRAPGSSHLPRQRAPWTPLQERAIGRRPDELGPSLHQKRVFGALKHPGVSQRSLPVCRVVLSGQDPHFLPGYKPEIESAL